MTLRRLLACLCIAILLLIVYAVPSSAIFIFVLIALTPSIQQRFVRLFKRQDPRPQADVELSRDLPRPPPLQ